MIECPQCRSQRLWRDGLRKTALGLVQRWLCRDCAHRFSETRRSVQVNADFQRKLDIPLSFFVSSEHSKRLPKLQSLILKGAADKPVFCQVGATQTMGAKNLAETETRTQEKAAGATLTPDSETVKGLIAQYAYWLEKEGHTVPGYLTRVKILANRGANLLDPENVKSIIAKQPWNKSTKMLTVYAYDSMAKMLKIEWTPPKYKPDEVIPFIPDEAELDQLIAACQSKRMSAFLQTLKETFADPGEAIRLRWIDINPTNSTITINQPVKGHNSRQLQVSTKLIALLMALPKTSERVFPMNYNSVHTNYVQFRKRVAYKLQNPRLLKISFNTFRHWGATMTYHYTRKILLVQKLLGHKRIESTMKYTKLVQFKDDEFDVETATTVDEAKDLLKAGFEYITERHDIMLFRRPKKFGPALGVPIDP